MTKEDVEAEWEKTRDIDNPLSPWVQVNTQIYAPKFIAAKNHNLW